MTPVQYCTGFIFCPSPESVTAKQNNHFYFKKIYFQRVSCFWGLFQNKPSDQNTTTLVWFSKSMSLFPRKLSKYIVPSWSTFAVFNRSLDIAVRRAGRRMLYAVFSIWNKCEFDIHRMSNGIFTQLSRMEFPTLINWISLFPLKGLLGGILHFYPISKRIFYKQTLETSIRRRLLQRRIWVCLCPQKGRLAYITVIKYMFPALADSVKINKCLI